jgi:hypothetical protein
MVNRRETPLLGSGLALQMDFSQIAHHFAICTGSSRRTEAPGRIVLVCATFAPAALVLATGTGPSVISVFMSAMLMIVFAANRLKAHDFFLARDPSPAVNLLF